MIDGATEVEYIYVPGVREPRHNDPSQMNERVSEVKTERVFFFKSLQLNS